MASVSFRFCFLANRNCPAKRILGMKGMDTLRVFNSSLSRLTSLSRGDILYRIISLPGPAVKNNHTLSITYILLLFLYILVVSQIQYYYIILLSLLLSFG